MKKSNYYIDTVLQYGHELGLHFFN